MPPSRLLKSLIAASLVVPPLLCGGAEVVVAQAEEPLPELPSLPGEERANRFGTLNVDAATITVRDRAVNDKVSVRVDDFKSPNPLVAFENGWLLSDQIGVGGTYTYRNNFAELFLNSVYVPSSDIRVQASLGQMRKSDAVASPISGDQKAVLQTNVVSSVKKSWDDWPLQSEAAVAVFASESERSGRSAAFDGIETGRLGGYVVRVATKPAHNSKIELSHRAEAAVYDRSFGLVDKQALNGIDYLHILDDCTLIHGGYSAGAGTERRMVELNRAGLTLGFAQTITTDGRQNAVIFGYSIPLGGGYRKRPSCINPAKPPPLFREVLDTTTARSPYLPSRLLARTTTDGLAGK